MTVKVKLVRDDKKEFVIDDVQWRVFEMEGWGSVDNLINTTPNAFGDGSSIDSVRTPEQDRTIKARLQNKHLNELMRQVLRSFLSYKHTYKVYITYGKVEKWCEGKLLMFDIPTNNIYKQLEMQFTILCNMPYLLSVDDFSENIAEVIPRFGFPFVSLVDKGFIFSEYKFAKEVLIDNDGDVETYCKLVITAKGDVKNPVIKKDDKFIRLLDNLVNGDTVVMDLISRPAKIFKNGENIIRLMDRKSSFTELYFSVGENKISFDAEQGSNNIDVVLYFNKRYVGI